MGGRLFEPAECNATIKSRRITSSGAVNAATIRAVVSGCAKAWGPKGGYTVEWVQTTLGKLQTLSTGHLSRAATPLVAIQIHGVFTKGSQAGPAETMLIRLFFGGTPSGVEVPVCESPNYLALFRQIIWRFRAPADEDPADHLRRPYA